MVPAVMVSWQIMGEVQQRLSTVQVAVIVSRVMVCECSIQLRG